MAPNQEVRLERRIGLLDVVMLGAGSAIGSSIFSVLAPAAQVGGAAMLASLAIAAVPMAIFALVYAFLSSAAPMTAASYEWQRRFTHPAFAFSVVWMRVLSNAVVMVLISRVLVNYLGMVVPLPSRPTMFLLITVVFILNYRGVGIAVRAQTILMFLLLVTFAIFVISGIHAFEPRLFSEAVAGGWGPVLATLPLMIQLFLSIETATEVGGEVRRAQSTIPLGLGIALILTSVVYGLIAFTALSLAGSAGLASSTAPLLDAARVSLGPWAVPLIIGAASLSLLKSMNAVFLVYARFLFAMGGAGVLPAAMARVHPRFATPHVATLVAYAASLLGIFLPSSLVFLLLAVNVPTMAKYFGSCAAAYSVAARHPDVFARSRLRFSRFLVKVLGLAGAVTAVAIAAVGISTDWRPYVLLAGWLSLGLLWYASLNRRRSSMTGFVRVSRCGS